MPSYKENKPSKGRQPAFIGYGCAVLATIAATLLRMALTPLVGDTAVPYIIYFPAVLATGWFWGLRPALVCTVLSALAGDSFFILPQYSLLLT